MGIAHHANYLSWFEIGRTDLCRDAGLPYGEIESKGLLLVVTEIACRYRVPFRYDEEVVITTRIRERATRSITFAYDLRGQGEPSPRATGSTAHLWVDAKTRKPVRPPAEIRDLFL